MKKALYIFAAIAIAFLFNSCAKDPAIPNLIDDNPRWNEYNTLADFSAARYPSDTDTWKITDSRAELAEFYGLREALRTAHNEGRKISLLFPNLTEIPSGRDSGDGAFSVCDALVSVDMPSVTSVGGFAFNSCFFLVSVNLPLVITLGDSAFFGCSSLISVKLPSVTSVGDSAFYGCSFLASISLPSATSVGDKAFYYCSDLSLISLPSVTSVGDKAFYKCQSITSINLPLVTSVGDCAFQYCSSFATMSLAIGDGVKLSSIGSASGYSAFRNMTTSSVTLTLGSANSGSVSGNTLTVGGVSATFKKIILVGGNGGEHEPYSTLADFSSTSYPTDSDTWTIADTTAEIAAFRGLRDALRAADDDGRKISLVFPNLTSVPSYPDGGDYHDAALYDCDALVSVDMPLATSVGADAFCRCSFLKSVKLPLVTTVGDYAFYLCDSLASIDLPLVTTVCYRAFDDCSALTSINLPLVTSVDDQAFYSCDDLTSINLPSVTSVGNSVFYGCSSLTSVDMPLVTTVGYNAFSSCSSLTSVTLATGYGVKLSRIELTPGSSAFEGLTTSNIILTLGSANSEYVSGNTLTVDGVSATFKKIILVDGSGGVGTYSTLADFSATSYPTDSDTWTITDTTAELSAFYGLRGALYAANEDGRKISLVFPNLTSVPEATESYYDSAFYNQDALVSVDMPSVTLVGKYAFYYCESLTSIELPLVTTVGSEAFFDCESLISVDVPLVTSVGLSAFFGCRSLTSINLPLVKSVGDSAFSSCSSLTSLNLPLVTTVGGGAFGYCSSLTSINLPLVTSVDRGAFEACNSLPSIDLPLVTSVGEEAFCGCNSLTSIDIPSSVTSIGGGAFNCCINLTTVNCATPNYIYEDGVIYNSDKSSIISALMAVVSGDFYSDSVTSVGDHAFLACSSLTSIDLPSVTTVGDDAFLSCTSLTTIDLPLVTLVGRYAFQSCISLTSMSLATGHGVKLSSIESTYGDSAFEGLTTSNVTLTLGSANSENVSGNTLTVGGVSETFKEIILVDGSGDEYVSYSTLADFSAASYPTDSDTWTITDISAEINAFYGLRDALRAADEDGRKISLVFPNLTSVPAANCEDSAFFNCDALVSVDMPLVIKVGAYAFYSCGSLILVDMPLMTSVGIGAFCCCNSLVSIDLPMLTTVGDYAFETCSSLTSINLPSVTSVGESAFSRCSSLISIALPMVTTVDFVAFDYCDSLSSVSLATGDGVKLSSIGSTYNSAFTGLTTSDITLTLGSANSEYVSGNTLTVGDISETFKKIILVDGNGDEYVPYSTLADFSSTSYPTNSDTWTITDTTAEIDAFYGLRDALYAANEDGRKISLVFPNLTSVPSSPVGGYYYEAAFYNCDALISVDMPSATSVGDHAFESCSFLTSVDLTSVTSVGTLVFCYCESLTSIDLLSVTSVGDSAFNNCSSLTSIELPLVTSVGSAAFGYCGSLTSMSLATGDGVKLSRLGSTSNSPFGYPISSDITLTIGSANSEYVNGYILTVGGVSEIFKEIIIL